MVLVAGPARTQSSASPVRTLRWAGVASLIATGCGVAALVSGHNPFAPATSALARAALGPTAVAGLFLALTLTGALTAAWAARASTRVNGRLSVVVVLELLGFGVALQSVSTMALAGYLVAMAVPFGLVWLAVLVILRYPRLRWLVIVALGTVVAWGVQTGTLQPTHLAQLAEQLRAGFARNALSLVFVVLVAATATSWVLLAMAMARQGQATSRLGDWALRHRRALTLLAAAGPLPYAVVRASWLTPWPLVVPSGEALDPEIRLWGLLLGGGALLGSVLTIGLLRPWGVTFPRWMPWLAGRPVPVRAATIPGGVVAGLLCAAAVPMLQMFLFGMPGTMAAQLTLAERLGSALLFPFWCWGPALALAVWGYALSRRGTPA